MSDWARTTLSEDQTHHLLGGQPLYADRFDEVLKFHAPGLAPVRKGRQAWHIDFAGHPAYARRFERTFGFYEERAAVISEHGWHHILPDGADVYPERFAWCGNYQGGRCTVRDGTGRYMHLGREGQPAYPERWRYAGDFRDGIAVVQRDDGCSTHIDAEGRLLHGRWFLDLDVFHKGFARARDEAGWMHIDRSGRAVHPRRFAMVEPFYNGQARAERHDGTLEVVNERGGTELLLHPPEPGLRPARMADGTWTHVDTRGQPAYASRFRAVSTYEEGFAIAHRFDGSAVFIDVHGHELPLHGLRFQWLLPFVDGHASGCTLDGTHGQLDREGRFRAEQADPEWRIRQELTRVAHLIYERGYNVSIDGNLSYRLDDGNLLMTPSGSHNGFIRPEEFVVTRPDGTLLRGDRRPTSEYRLHVELHRTRPDCRCVIHVHPPHAVAASVAGVDLHKTYASVAPVPTTEYARISSEQSPTVLRPYLEHYNWAILPRHGVVAWSDTIWNTFLRIEGLEHYAKVVMTARACGPIEPISPDKRIELLTFWGLEHLEKQP